MTRDELTDLVLDNAGRLAAKLEEAVLDRRPDDAVRWADALHATAASIAELHGLDDE
jgi:hypothetical protein